MGDDRGTSWAAIAAVVVVTVLTATSVVGLARIGRDLRPVASTTPLVSPSPAPIEKASPSPSPSPEPPSVSVQISAPSANVIWALADYAALFVSTDRGVHWQKRTVPGHFGIRPTISFINSNEGWLLAPGSGETQCEAQLADVWHTTDGARSWQDMGARLDKTQCKGGIWFTDSAHGFVAASDSNHHPTVYRTTDGGDRWTVATIPDNPIFTTAGGGFSLRVAWIKSLGQTLYLEASGMNEKPGWPGDFIYMSKDGGATWTWKQKIASPSTFLVTDLRWLQLAPDVDESLNGGQEFHPYTTNLHVKSPVGATFPDAQDGYATSGGAVFHTLDGGATWTQLATPWQSPIVIAPSPSPSPISLPTSADLSAPSANVLWALIGNSRLFVSTDRGRTWQERSVPSGAAATEIAFVDDTYGWLTTCADTRTLMWRTTDGARSWQTVSSPFPPDQCLLGLAFVDRSLGFITEHFDYAPPSIFTTPDGGLTWNGAPLDNPPGFQPGQPGNAYTVGRIARVGGMFYMSASGAVGGATGGYVYRSSDQGATWRYLLTAPYPLDSLVFVTASRWLILGNDGNGQETTDAGKTWHVFKCNYNDAAGVFSTFTFADASVGYGTVRGGIQVTTDGGLHWTRIKTPGT